MFSLLKTLVKIAALAIAVLIAGHWIQWKGSSLSQHAKVVSDVLKTEASSAREWVEDQEIQEKLEEKTETLIRKVNQGMNTPPLPTAQDQIKEAEKEQLKSLLRNMTQE